jgi:hypothetical protein
MPLSAPYITRELVRPLPSSAQSETVNAALANAGTIQVAYDVALVVTDRNQLGGGAAPGAPTPRFAIGPLLDVVVFSSAVGTLLIEYGVAGGSYHPLSNSAVPASTLVNISGLRITARFVRITFTNTSGGNAAVEFGAYVRSN